MNGWLFGEPTNYLSHQVVLKIDIFGSKKKKKNIIMYIIIIQNENIRYVLYESAFGALFFIFLCCFHQAIIREFFLYNIL